MRTKNHYLILKRIFRFVARCYPPMAGRYNTPIWPYTPTMAKK